MKLGRERKFSDDEEEDTLPTHVVFAVWLVVVALFFGYGGYLVGAESRQGEIDNLRFETVMDHWQTEDLLDDIATYTCTSRGAIAEMPYGMYRGTPTSPIKQNLLVVCEAGFHTDPAAFQRFVCQTGDGAQVLRKTNYCRY